MVVDLFRFDAINAETSFDGGKYADGTAAVVFNTFFKDHATLDKNLSYGVFLYKQGNATGTKVSLEKGISEDGFISVIVDAIPAESQDDYIVCVPYTVSGDVLTAGVTTTVKASDLSKNLVK